MTILYPPPAPVKSSRRFGSGILPTRPVYRAPFTASDLAWLALDNARRENARYDRMAGASAALDMMESGLRCC